LDDSLQSVCGYAILLTTASESPLDLSETLKFERSKQVGFDSTKSNKVEISDMKVPVEIGGTGKIEALHGRDMVHDA
jgi:hypothetical protein